MISSKFDLLRFIEHPKSFIKTTTDSTFWQKGLAITKAVTKNDKIQLRAAQEAAWQGMTNDQLGLLLGPPGTGKTFTISAMACGLLAACHEAGRPCRIFVTGFTRNSIENVLEYIEEFAQKYPKLEFSLAYDKSTLTDKNINAVKDKDFASFLNHEHSVFGGTVWTLYRILHNKRHLEKGKRPKEPVRQAPIFDFVIIDEASQVQFTHGLMAMAGLKGTGRMLICGDNNQLSPIFDAVLDIEDNAAEQSIYDFLATHSFPEFALNETFRLNRPLVDFVSQEYYSGNYISAQPVRNRTITYHDQWATVLPQWKQAILDPQIPFVVLVHDGVEAGKLNPDESQIVLSLVQGLHDIIPGGNNFWEEELAVISPHRMNNEHLREILDCVAVDPYVDTVDRFQGRERNCIIYSMCVSDPEFAQHEPSFLYSPNRLNVAITRARSKLILIVSRNILHVMLKEDEHIEALNSFRKLVFCGEHIGKLVLKHYDQRDLTIDIYGKAFTAADVARASQLIKKERTNPTPSVLHATPSLPVFTQHLHQILTIIQRFYTDGKNKSWYNIKLSQIEQELTQQEIGYCFNDFIKLFQIGEIYLLKHFDNIVVAMNYKKEVPVMVNTEDIHLRIMEILYANQNKMFYTKFKTPLLKYLVWVNNHRKDILWPILQEMAAQQLITIEDHPKEANEKIILLQDFGLFENQ